ncbi:MAG: hypothetical protein J5585_10495, partial [Clostridia bacterium]|nr:hypothetical protein [Clostridia bacterium]
MSKMKTRIMSVLLAVVMTLSLAPFGVLSDFAKSALPVAAAKDYAVGDIIEFGGYPQTLETDAATVAALNNEVAQTAWKSYRYYSGDGRYGSYDVGDWMRYADFMYNGSKYRAVTFDTYRPDYTRFQSQTAGSRTYHQELNSYVCGNVYFFEWEPLKWRVLDPSSGLVMSENLIDSQSYSNTIYGNPKGYTNDAEGDNFANDYVTSSIRDWLLHDFYYSAFSYAEQALIKITQLDNSAYSRWTNSCPQYDSASTTDKIFLLSNAEIRNTTYGFSQYNSDTARSAQGTDYAKCQGLYVYDSGVSCWWLRSPGSMNYSACDINHAGFIDSRNDVDGTFKGVRPAFQFKSGISESSNPHGGDGTGQTSGNGTTVQNNSVLTLTASNLDQWVSWSYGNESLRKFYNDHPHMWALKDAKASVGSNAYFANDKGVISVDKAGITQDVVVSRDDYYDYIIPQDVAVSLDNGKLNTAYHLNVYMQKDRKNGKPYISTVFAKQDVPGENYVELKTEKMTLYTGLPYRFCISAGNLNEPATYYLSQDNSHRYSSSTGEFVFDNSSAALVMGEKVYVYAVTTSGVVTEPVELKLKIYEGGGTENTVKKVLGDGSINLGGKDGFAITLPADWVLVGGSSITLCDFKAPIGVEVSADSVKVSVGFDFFEKETTEKTAKSKVTYPDGSVADKTHYLEHDTKVGWSAFKESLKGGSALGMKDIMSTAEMRSVKKQLCQKYGVKFSDLSSNNLKRTNLSGEFLGYMEGTIVDGKIVFTDIMIRAGGSFTFTYTYQMAVGHVGVEAGGSASIGLQWSREFADANQPLDFDIVFSVEPSLKVFAGLGIKDVASFDVYGKGTMPTSVEFTDQVFSIALKGEIGYEAQFLFWSTGEQPLLSGTLGPETIYFGSDGKSSGAKSAVKKNTADVSATGKDFVLIDRASDISDWLDNAAKPKKAPMKNVALSGVTEKTLQTGVYSMADPSVASCADTTLAVWTQDSLDRDDYNRLCAVYSVYDNATDTWSAPRAICDNGCNSFSPVASSDGEHLYIAWQQANRMLTEDDCADYTALLAATEIWSAVYDPASGEFADIARLTDNDVYDYSPAVGFTEEGPVLFYAQSTEPEFYSPEGNSLHKVDAGTDTVIASDIATISGLTAGGGQVAFSADTDGDLSTSGDISVFYGSDTLSVFPKSDENTPNLNPVFGKMNGETTLFVTDGKNIYYLQDNEPTAVLEEPASVGSRICALKNDGELELLWAGLTESGSELYTCSFDGEAWSSAVQLTEKGNLFSGFDAAACDSHVVIFAAETEREYDETNEIYRSGGTNLIALRENDFCNMSVSELFVNELGVVEGDQSELSFTLENKGNTLFESAALLLSDTCGTEQNLTLECEILPGKSEIITVPYVIPANFAGSTVTVEIQPDGDTDPSDNSVSYTSSASQLTTVKDSVTHIGDSYILSCLTTASGFTDAEDVVVSVSFDDADGDAVDAVYADTIKKETGFISEFAFLASELPFDGNGVAVVYVTAEAANGESTTEAFTVTRDDTVCAHPLSETVALAPTCTEDGYSDRVVCSCCREILEEGTAIGNIGHNFGAWESLDDERHQRVCANDASHVETAAHEWNGGEITTAATTTAEGVKTFTCTVCGETMTEAIPKALAKIAVTAENVSTGIKLTWVQDENATGYYVYRKTASTSYKAIRKITSNTTLTYTDTSAEPGTKYTYCVKSYRGTERGTYTAKSITCLAPITPTLANGKTGMTLTWTKAEGADGYYVYRKTGTGSYTTLAKIEDPDMLTYTDTTAVSGTKYTYGVRAYKSTTKGAYTAKSMTRLSPVTPTLTNTASGIYVKWTKVTGATGYYVYRKAGTGSYSLVKKIADNATVTFTDTAVKDKNGVKYTYIVKAYKSTTKSAYT